jgi:hypothetical protein
MQGHSSHSTSGHHRRCERSDALAVNARNDILYTFLPLKARREPPVNGPRKAPFRPSAFEPPYPLFNFYFYLSSLRKYLCASSPWTMNRSALHL